MVNVVVDIETTGLIAGVHDMIEIAVTVYNEDKMTPTGLCFSSLIQFTDRGTVDPNAMLINRISRDDLKSAPTSRQVRQLFLAWKDELFENAKLFVLGNNYDGFDKQFIRLWLGDLYEDIFHYHSRDVWQLADICRRLGLIRIEKLSLESLKNHFNIEIKSHRAKSDTLITLEVYKRLWFLLSREVTPTL